MWRFSWTTILLALAMLTLPARAWALHCGTHIVQQGDVASQGP